MTTIHEYGFQYPYFVQRENRKLQKPEKNDLSYEKNRKQKFWKSLNVFNLKTSLKVKSLNAFNLKTNLK
jgi:hypothetical protein